MTSILNFKQIHTLLNSSLLETIEAPSNNSYNLGVKTTFLKTFDKFLQIIDTNLIEQDNFKKDIQISNSLIAS